MRPGHACGVRSNVRRHECARAPRPPWVVASCHSVNAGHDRWSNLSGAPPAFRLHLAGTPIAKPARLQARASPLRRPRHSRVLACVSRLWNLSPPVAPEFRECLQRASARSPVAPRPKRKATQGLAQPPASAPTRAPQAAPLLQSEAWEPERKQEELVRAAPRASEEEWGQPAAEAGTADRHTSRRRRPGCPGARTAPRARKHPLGRLLPAVTLRRHGHRASRESARDGSRRPCSRRSRSSR